MRHTTAAILIGSIICLTLAACAGVETKPDITAEQVQKMLDAAQYSGAETKSPYAFYSADLFYREALEEYNQGNWKTARYLFHRAYQQAQIAYDNARKFRKAK